MNKYIALLIILSPLYAYSSGDIHKGCAHLQRGIVEGSENLVEVSRNLVKTAEILKETVSEKNAHEVGKGLITGAAAGLVVTGKLAATSVSTAAQTAVATVIAAPATPWIASGLAIGWFAKWGIGVEKNKTYGRCIRTHWDSPANASGIPMRCESPERRAAWWDKEEAERQTRFSNILRRQGRRPRPMNPKDFYGSPCVIWERDLDRKDDK